MAVYAWDLNGNEVGVEADDKEEALEKVFNKYGGSKDIQDKITAQEPHVVPEGTVFILCVPSSNYRHDNTTRNRQEEQEFLAGRTRTALRHNQDEFLVRRSQAAQKATKKHEKPRRETAIASRTHPFG